MALLIREAQLSDAAGLAEVHVRTWQHAYHGILPDEFLDSLSVERRTSQWELWLSQPSPNMAVFVAVVGGSIAGFSWVGEARDDDFDESTGELFAIYVLPNLQGKGIGTQLIDQAIDHLRVSGFSEAILWVLAKNEPSRRFYEHRGWKPDGATKVENWREIEFSEMLLRKQLPKHE